VFTIAAMFLKIGLSSSTIVQTVRHASNPVMLVDERRLTGA